jgi:hypothetical protein
MDELMFLSAHLAKAFQKTGMIAFLLLQWVLVRPSLSQEHPDIKPRSERSVEERGEVIEGRNNDGKDNERKTEKIEAIRTGRSKDSPPSFKESMRRAQPILLSVAKTQDGLSVVIMTIESPLHSQKELTDFDKLLDEMHHPALRSWIIKNGQPIPDDMAEALRTPTSIIHVGAELPESFRFSDRSSQYVRKSNRSKNLTAIDLQEAIHLGTRPLEPQKTAFFNALPQAEGLTSSMLELRRMKLDIGQRREWNSASKQIREKARHLKFLDRVPTKTALLQELATGAQDVVVVVAHSDTATMYMPGNSQPITLADLVRIRRPIPPNRIVILITCGAGTVNGRTPSLGEAILQNGLAKTVLASPYPVYAEKVPEILSKITEPYTNLRQALSESSFIQIVRNGVHPQMP